jgi:hypothetical protein
MKTLTLALGVLLTGQAAQASSPTLDQIDTLKCAVTQASVRDSFIPPMVGDTLVYATWQDTISELRFERPGHPEAHPYIPLHSDLERVDHSGMRNENLRTFVGIRESLAHQYRQEAIMKVEVQGVKIKLSYQQRVRSLPHGQFTLNGSMTMNCAVTKLNP